MLDRHPKSEASRERGMASGEANNNVMKSIHIFFMARALFAISFLLGILIFTAHLANPLTLYAGEVYRWVDEEGEVHFSDTAPNDSSAKDRKIKSSFIQDSDTEAKEIKSAPWKSADSSGKATSKDVTIYVRNTCPYCRQVKEFLSQKGISYKEIEVSQDRDRRDEMIRISGQRGVPVIVINNKVIVGFNRQAIEENLR